MEKNHFRTSKKDIFTIKTSFRTSSKLFDYVQITGQKPIKKQIFLLEFFPVFCIVIQIKSPQFVTIVRFKILPREADTPFSMPRPHVHVCI